MTWDPQLHTDGETTTGTALDRELEAARDYINDIDDVALRDGTFNRHHAGTVLRNLTGNTAVTDGSGSHTYDETAQGGSLTYSSFGNNTGRGGADPAGTGDRVIIGQNDSGPYTGGDALITFPGSGYYCGMTNGSEPDNCAGIEVLLNVEIIDIVLAGATGAEVMTCIQYQLNGTTWYTLDESERFWDVDSKRTPGNTDPLRIDASYRGLIAAAEVGENGTPASDRVTAIRAMVSLYATAGGGSMELTLGEWNLTALAWRAGDVT